MYLYSVKVIIVLVSTLAISSGFKLVPEGRIVNGWNARRDDAPFIVSMWYPNPYYPSICGGSIINEHWVLTAGHCLKNMNISAIRIHAGRYNLRADEDSDQVRSVDYYKLHELYIGGVAPYDIGLIYTAKPFIWTEFVKPISLPEDNAIPEGDALLFGWGLISSPFQGKILFPEVLQTAVLPVVSLDECRKAFPIVHETNVCTSSTFKGMTACNADSGGPLAQKNADKEDVLIGIVSWGKRNCGQPNDYSVFVRVSAFVDWIRKTQKQFKLNGAEE